MFEEFFEKCEIQDPEKITQAQSENIRSALQKKLAADHPLHTEEKEKSIMKSKSIRTIIIAAAIAVVGLAGVVGATSALLTREEIATDLADKNSVSPEFAEYVAEATKDKEDLYVPPFYKDMGEINELVVREMAPADYKGYTDEDFPGIILQHIDAGKGGVEVMIKSDGNGGYLYMDELITDEKLLAAIAEGTEKYGDTFIIMY